MKNQAVIDELTGLGIYSVDYTQECNPSDNNMTIVDNDKSYRKVDDNGLSEDDLNLLLAAKQASYLRSIKWIATFYAILTSIGLILGFIFIILPLMS